MFESLLQGYHGGKCNKSEVSHSMVLGVLTSGHIRTFYTCNLPLQEGVIYPGKRTGQYKYRRLTRIIFC